MSTAAGPKCRPILFSSPMVRALIDGRKTQTRRVVKAPKWWSGMTHYCTGLVDSNGLTMTNMALCEATAKSWKYCPYGVPGDRLWVRETWTRSACWYAPERAGPLDPHDADYAAYYRADGEVSWKSPGVYRRRPLIHMPRRASRITLEITSVRVQRLNAITPEDAAAEGIEEFAREHKLTGYYTTAFARLWETINGEGSWARNEWVWVLEFRRVES